MGQAIEAQEWIGFASGKRVARGAPVMVAETVKALYNEQPPADGILVFEATSSQPVELDLRGSLDDVRRRYAADPSGSGTDKKDHKPRGRGRPKLGVVAREVTLLPRHWEWLGRQPGGASAALRRLVDQARKSGSGDDQKRIASEACYRFMHAIAGNEPGFEDATRYLYAGKQREFEVIVSLWPADVGAHAKELAESVFMASG